MFLPLKEHGYLNGFEWARVCSLLNLVHLAKSECDFNIIPNLHCRMCFVAAHSFQTRGGYLNQR